MTIAIAEKIAFSFPAEVVKQTEEQGEFHVVGYAATTDFDLQGDIITEDALKNASQDLLTNSTVLLNHDITHPIGKVTKVELDKNGLLIDALISKSEPDLIQKIKEGILNKFSIRGEVLQREKKYVPELDRVANVIESMTLLEVSVVSVPANPEAKAIGWYVSKALQEADSKDQGGSAMSQETVVEEIKSEEAPAIETPAPKADPAKPKGPEDPEEPAAASAKTEVNKGGKGGPEDPEEDEDPQKASGKRGKKGPKAKKDMVADGDDTDDEDDDDYEDCLEQSIFLLDTLIAMGSPVGAIAQKIKALVIEMAELVEEDESAEDDTDTTKGLNPRPAAGRASAPAAISKADVAELISTEVKKQVEAAMKAIPPVRKGVIQPNNESEELQKTFQSLSPDKKLKVALALQQD